MLIPNKTYFEIYVEEPTIVGKVAQPKQEISYGNVCEIGVIAVIEAIFSALGIDAIFEKIIGKSH